MIRLHQTQINCGNCGSELWRVTRFLMNLDANENEETEEDPVCRNCDPRRYYELLRHAQRIESLTGTGEKQRLKTGIVERMKEQKPK